MIKIIRTLSFLFLFANSFLAFAGSERTLLPSANDAAHRAAVIDLGSGATKLIIGESLQGGCITPFYKKRLHNKLADQLHQNNYIIDDVIKNNTISVIKEMIKQAVNQNVPTQNIKIIATQALRDAKNAHALDSALFHQTGHRITVISQEEEAELGFLSSEHLFKQQANQSAPLVSFDIGGGSFQIVGRDNHKKIIMLNGQIGSSNFKNYVLQELQIDAHTPNPVNENHWTKIKEIAKDTFYQITGKQTAVFNQMKQKIKKSHSVAGIGSLHNHAIKSDILDKLFPEKKEHTFYTKDDLYRAKEKLLNLSDEDLIKTLDLSVPAFAQTILTDLALIITILEEMDIFKIDLLESSICHGQLIHSH